MKDLCVDVSSVTSIFKKYLGHDNYLLTKVSLSEADKLFNGTMYDINSYSKENSMSIVVKLLPIKDKNTLFLVTEPYKSKVSILGGHISNYNYRVQRYSHHISKDILLSNLVRETFEEALMDDSMGTVQQDIYGVYNIYDALMRFGLCSEKAINWDNLYMNVDLLGKSIRFYIILDTKVINNERIIEYTRHDLKTTRYMDIQERIKYFKSIYKNDIRINKYNPLLEAIFKYILID